MGYCRGLFFWKSLNLSYLQGFGYVFVMAFYENVRAWTHIFFIPSINEEISANKYILKVNQINASKKCSNVTIRHENDVNDISIFHIFLKSY